MRWKAMAMGRGFEDDDRDELEEAYHEGRRRGYEEAMREMGGDRYGERGGGSSRGGYGERDGGSSGGSSRGGYGERESRMFDPYEREDMYGERRGVRGTGPYSRYRR